VMSGWATALFLVACGTALYIMAGYPLLLAWLARRMEKPVLKELQFRRVSIIIAVYNGEGFLGTKIDSILNSDYPRDLMEIIVVSDGSTDSTDAIASKYEERGIRLLRVPKSGKPAAINAGANAASGDLLIFTDVRQTFGVHSLAYLIACFADPEVGVASGYLVIEAGDTEQGNVGMYWRYERWIRTNLSRIDSTLGATGAFYAVRRSLFRPMPADTLLDDVWVPMAAFFAGYRIVIEEEAKMFDHPTSVNAEFRRKVRTLAGNYQLLWQYPDLLTRRNRLLFHFLSYKVARLLLPWNFLAILTASFFLPGSWKFFALIPQAVFYGLAGLDFVLDSDSALKRISSPARTVVSMLAATACAIAIFFVSADRFWKPTRTAAATR
jgi:biofilm PGA synthesis N-glycosyltransferase PgaC